ncbi:MAG: glycoside hydrolase family 3 protein [bacterium]|nr:glycoside hydrolase family 3 protein [bacterium]
MHTKEQIISGMTVREKIGQIIMMDFRNWGKDNNGEYIPFTKMNSTVSEIINKYNLGGIALFKENTAAPEQIINLVNDIKKSSKIGILLGIDQEGGIVTRLQTGTDMPGNMSLGASNSSEITKEVARAIGNELNSLGINLNFAPTIDVNSNPRNPIIGVRSFSCSPEIVSKLGVAYIEGLKKSSVLSCIKHFPGHGNTAVDTHIGLATVDNSLNELEEIDLKPFKDAINSGADSIMIAHVIVPALDDSKQLSKKDNKTIGNPATLSHKIITKLLKYKFGFKGLIITDALDMKAISDNFGSEEATVRTILAGSDMAVMPIKVWDKEDIYKLDELFLSLEKLYNNNPTFKARVNESVDKIISLKINKKIINDPSSTINLLEKISLAEKIVGCKEHRNIEFTAASKGITLIKNEENILPYNFIDNSKILVLDDNQARINLLSDSLKEVSKKISHDSTIITKKINPSDSVLPDSLINSINEADLILMVTYNINSNKTIYNAIISHCNDNSKNLVSISARNPYDIAYLANCKTNIAIYGAVGFDQTNAIQAALSVNIKTVGKMIFKNPKDGTVLLKPEGKLPVDIINYDTNEIIYKIGHGLTY